MSLNYDLTKVANWKELCWMPDGEQNPVTKVLIFDTMFVGMGEITEKNYQKFFKRVYLLERTDDAPMVLKDGKPYHITLTDVKNHVGLKCNVAEETDNWFYKQLVKFIPLNS